jgi:hypothetical protein
LNRLGELQNLFGGGFAGHGNPDSPQLMTHYDPALQLPLAFEKQVQMEVLILKGCNAKWVWNTRFIRNSEYLDIRKTACNVLKELVTGHFAYMW